jgi:hypothetical protein
MSDAPEIRFDDVLEVLQNRQHRPQYDALIIALRVYMLEQNNALSSRLLTAAEDLANAVAGNDNRFTPQQAGELVECFLEHYQENYAAFFLGESNQGNA